MPFEQVSAAPAGHTPTPGTASYRVGDWVLVLVGDTLVPAAIDSMCSPVDGREVEWNVRQHGAARAYPVAESFLQPAPMPPT